MVTLVQLVQPAQWELQEQLDHRAAQGLQEYRVDQGIQEQRDRREIQDSWEEQVSPEQPD